MNKISEIILELPVQSSRYIISGPSGSGKSLLLLERYHHMVNELNISSENILILLMNRSQSLKWRDSTKIRGSGAILRTSFYGFIQGEINTFYPIILSKTDSIKKRDLRPIFLTFDSAQFLVAKVIEKRRQTHGIFDNLTSYHDKIAIDLVANIVKASNADIPYYEIGKRLYDSLELKDERKKKMFEDCDSVIIDYRKRCLELGVFDFGMTLEFFKKYLISDDTYRTQLHKRIRHLIIDNIEESVPSEVDFIIEMEPYLDSCLMASNPQGGYGEIFGGNFEYGINKLESRFKKIDINSSHTCSQMMYEFSEMLFDNITNIEAKKKSNWIDIERMASFELRSDMLEAASNNVVKIIEEGLIKPNEIAVISTYADPVTEAVFNTILGKVGIGFKNIARKSRVIDNPFLKALITLAKLCHPKFGYLPGRDEVKELSQMMLAIDPVRSNILANEVLAQRPYARFPDIEFPGVVERIGYYNLEKYKYIQNWIEEYKNRENPLPINEFFQKIFLEILISDRISGEDIIKARDFIDGAENFTRIISRFNRNSSKDFIEMMNKGVKAAESIFEMEEKFSGNEVIMATPVSYLASSLSHKVIILLGISSKNWTPRSIKELTNVHVLTKTWNPEEVYSEDIEEVRQKKYLAIVMRNLTKRCKHKLITYESDLSSAGYENDGILSEYFDEIILSH